MPKMVAALSGAALAACGHVHVTAAVPHLFVRRLLAPALPAAPYAVVSPVAPNSPQSRDGEADSTPDDILKMVKEQAAPPHRCVPAGKSAAAAVRSPHTAKRGRSICYADGTTPQHALLFSCI
jgi:hypothetical protein